MRLTSVHIREYKSIRDSNRLAIGDITCLVGKNEAGKTALLEAIYRLNPIDEKDAKFDLIDDYPRATVEEYRLEVEKHKRQHATVIEAVFQLESSDLAKIADEIGESTIREPYITLRRGYANALTYEFDLDEAGAVRGLVQKANLPDEIGKEALSDCGSVKELLDFLNKKSAQQTKAYTDAQNAANGITDTSMKARALDEAKALAESEAAKELRSRLTHIVKSGLVDWVWNQSIKGSVPKFLYFDEYYQMLGHVNIEQLRQRQQSNQLLDSDRPMLALIELARLRPDQLLNLQRTEELLNSLEGAGNHLNRQLLRYWSQSAHIAVKFDLRPGRAQDPPEMRQGTNLLGRVYDSIHAVTTPLGRRSKGFVWFFSFLAYFSQQKRRDEQIILLLD